MAKTAAVACCYNGRLDYSPSLMLALRSPILFLAFALGFGVGCDSARPQRRYALVGVVQRMLPEQDKVVVAHEDIPGFMPSMTMAFRLADPPDGLRAGDQILASLVLAGDDIWLEGVSITARDEPVAAPPAIAIGAEPGDLVPGLELVNQNESPLRLDDYRGRVLVLTFIFTRCPLPEFCPRLMQHFARIDTALTRMPEVRARTHLLSISFDPEHDTPQVLREYAELFVPKATGDRFRHWEFATGTPEQVRAVTEFFGVDVWGEGAEITHSLRTALIAADGRIARTYRGSDWSVDELLTEIALLVTAE
jgi:protein SCO1/2